jgi:hypothetical protein
MQMNTKKFLLLFFGLICGLGLVPVAQAQSSQTQTSQVQTDELPKFEVGILFTSLTKPNFDGGSTEPGIGGRFTFNLNRTVALEAEGNLFPHSCSFCGANLGDNSGIIKQGLFGVKVGRRFEKWGIFGKARPGVVTFGQGNTIYTIAGTGPSALVSVRRVGLTNFAMDVGGVIEVYPSKRFLVRFDGGDTLIHYRSRQVNFLSFDPTTNSPVLFPFTTRAETRHNFQFSAGVGFRF